MSTLGAAICWSVWVSASRHRHAHPAFVPRYGRVGVGQRHRLGPAHGHTLKAALFTRDANETSLELTATRLAVGLCPNLVLTGTTRSGRTTQSRVLAAIPLVIADEKLPDTSGVK